MSDDEKIKYPDFSGLQEVTDSFKSNVEIISDIKKLGSTGMPVEMKDLFIHATGIYVVLKDGILKKVALCKDESYLSLSEDKEPPVFHILLCDDIKNNQYAQRVAKRAERYKVHRTMPASSPGGRRVSICPFCLRRYNSMTKLDLTPEEFNLKGFLNRELNSGHKEFFFYDNDKIPGMYEKIWQNLSEFVKRKSNYTCDKCSIELSRSYLRQHFLNSHYTSQIIGKNSGKNIRKKGESNRIETINTLCIRCHAEEQNHEEIRKYPDYKEFMELLEQMGR